MEDIFRNIDVAFVAKCVVIIQKSAEDQQHHHVDIQSLMIKHDHVFGKIQLGIPPDRGFEHTLELEEGSKPVITSPWRHPKKSKYEIEKVIEELLEMGNIRPSSSPFTSSVVLVMKKDGSMRMCINYMDMNKNTIKNMYPIHRIDEVLDEFDGVVYFSKINIGSRYHHIRVREEDFLYTTFK
jgi:hypothetical protein